MHGARNVGGGEYSVYQLISGLDRENFVPLVFYSHENKIITKLRRKGVQTVAISLNNRIISVYRDEIKSNPFIILSYFWYMLKGVNTVYRALKKFNVVILHPHDNLSKIIGGIAAKIANVKTVTQCHDQLGSGKIELALKLYQLAMMDKIIAVSENVRDTFAFRNKISCKVCTIHNGIPLQDFNFALQDSLRNELNLRPELVVIGIIAVFDECKGHSYLFQAVKQLVLEGNNNFVCLVAGDGRIALELKKYCRQENLTEFIRFLGYRDDIPALLRTLDIVVVPSLKESFGIVPLEAMAMKVTVIATRVGGLPEVVDDGATGILVPPEDAASLSAAIKYLIENPGIRKQMGEKGRDRVERQFTVEKNITNIEAVYREVFSRN